MSFTKSSQKPTEKVSSDNAVLSFDLLSNLTYMAALAAGSAPRDIIFEYVITQPYKTAIYFKRVYMLTKKLGFEYSRAFQLVSKKAGAGTIKSLLLRFAGSISSGESEHDFLTQEARVEREQYVNSYQRSVETLQKWADAYAALLVSTSLIVVVAMIYDIGSMFVFLLTGTMFIMSFFGTFIIYKSAPYEIKNYQNNKGPKERQRARLLLLVLCPIGALGAVYLTFSTGLGHAFLFAGVCLMPGGVFAYLDDSKVSKIDEEVAKFIRSLGSVSGALGSTVSVALEKIDRRSLGTLEPYIQRLQRRLRSHINPKVCWDKFIDETGSELVARSTAMFVDGTSLGGSPERVGTLAGDYAIDVALLRAKRHVTALPFAYLTVPLHGAMSALLIFVMGIMAEFNAKLGEASTELGAQGGGALGQIPNLPMFQSREMGHTALLTLATVVVLTIANAFAAQFATGGHIMKVAFYGSIMCTLSGINLILIPPIAEKLLT